LLVGATPLLAIIVLVSFFFLIHYMFASLTAHTMAFLPAMLAAGSPFPGLPVRVLGLLRVYSIGLMGVITRYATGPAPVYFGSGFIPRKDLWVLGCVFGLIYLKMLLGVGIPYLRARPDETAAAPRPRGWQFDPARLHLQRQPFHSKPIRDQPHPDCKAGINRDLAGLRIRFREG
jgi:Sodium:sulfate symporter transmembrane region